MATISAWQDGILAALTARLPAMLADLERLVGCESPSQDLGMVAESARVTADLGAVHLGCRPEVLVRDGRTHLIWRLGSGTPRVLLLGHHDTVWPAGSLRTHPGRVDQGPTGPVARGPGCFDMKAGLVQAFHALALLPDTDGVTLLVTGDEEIGSPSSRQLIEHESRQAAAALVLEASANGGALKTQRKGVSLYEVQVTGKAAHAGLEPERGVNAGLELAHVLLRIAELGDPALGTTVTPTALSAGTTTNTVPARARLAVDVRAVTAAEQRRVHEQMTSLRPTLRGAALDVTGAPNRSPLEAAMSADLFRLASSLNDELGLPPLTSAAVGGGSDGNFTAGVGTPTLDGLGAVGGGAHADDEHVLAEWMPRRAALLAVLVGQLLRSGGQSA